MFLKIFIFFIVIYFYYHIYLMFKVNINNEISNYDNYITKQEITNEINIKLPFVLNSGHLLNNDICYNSFNNIDNKIDYISRPILEPFVRFNTNNVLYKLNKKQNIGIKTNKHFRNFYIVNNGVVKVILIHPKYNDNFIKNNCFISNKEMISFVKKNDNFITKELRKNDILFLPNYWSIFIEARQDNTNIELIQYKSLLNNICFYVDKFKNKIM